MPGGKRTAGVSGNIRNYLRRKGSLLNVAVSAPPIAESKYMHGQALNNFQNALASAKEGLASSIAISARNSMSRLIAPGGKPKIGVTGRSSKNLFVRQVSRATGNGNSSAVYYIVEGSPGWGNKAIRKGTKAKQGKVSSLDKNAAAARGSGTGVTNISGGIVGSIKAWAKERGFSPVVSFRKVQVKSKQPRKGHLSLKPHNKVATYAQAYDRMVWGIYRNMLRQGTSMSYVDRFGSKFFDYVSYVTGGSNIGSSQTRLYDYARKRLNYRYLKTNYFASISSTYINHSLGLKVGVGATYVKVTKAGPRNWSTGGMTLDTY